MSPIGTGWPNSWQTAVDHYYRGLRDRASPEKTVWQFTAFGGLYFSDAGGVPTKANAALPSGEILDFLNSAL